MARRKKTPIELENEAAAIRRELDVLSTFRKQPRSLIQLRMQLKQELLSVENRIAALMPIPADELRARRDRIWTEANLARSVGQKNYNRYIRQVRDMWVPEMSIPEVKSDFKNFRVGRKSKISRTQYYNPSL